MGGVSGRIAVGVDVDVLMALRSAQAYRSRSALILLHPKTASGPCEVFGAVIEDPITLGLPAGALEQSVQRYIVDVATPQKQPKNYGARSLLERILRPSASFPYHFGAKTPQM
jgi:hypothetical protein